jgi:hypothetical protein
MVWHYFSNYSQYKQKVLPQFYAFAPQTITAQNRERMKRIICLENRFWALLARFNGQLNGPF